MTSCQLAAMADYALALGTIALLTWLFLVLARGLRLARPFVLARRSGAEPRSLGRSGALLALALLLATATTAAGLFRLSKSRTFQLAGELISRVETSELVVALTFDDGPTPGFTAELLATLAGRGARATPRQWPTTSAPARSSSSTACIRRKSLPARPCTKSSTASPPWATGL